MITVNVGGLSEGVFESELFGHLKGAFTDAKADRIGRFELADHGTIFLDEIANMTPGQQTRILRVLNTGEFERVGSSRTRRVEARVFSATNADLATEVATGRFREDLLYRLNTIEIRIPTLRERREDIPLLAAQFLDRYAAQYRKALRGFRPDAMAAILAYAWPGNVRELDHTLERAVLLADDAEIKVADLSLSPGGDRSTHLDQMTLEEVERVLIQKALARADDNVTEAAKALGLSRSAMYRRLERFGL
jgi:DNA-binding NtrC family response regulator